MVTILLVLIFLAVAAVAAAVIWLISVLVRRIETLDQELEDSHRREFLNLADLAKMQRAHWALQRDLANAHTCLDLVLTQKETPA